MKDIFVLPFERLSMKDAHLAGGKGASLGEMTRVGISVPSGFVVLTSAFEKFIEETDLDVEIDAALDAVNHEEIHTVEAASERIQELILEAEAPANIQAAIMEHFRKLNTRFVAVRSSATAEDSSTAAWAGQLNSYLNTSEDDLLKNVKKCWASLFTPRAIFYRFEKELRKQKISVAVVVQKMIESEVSGIAFSVHPITQDRNQIIVEAGFGLGEAIVSGQVTPDSYVVEKQTWRIIDKNVNEQERAIVRKEGGGDEWITIPKEKATAQKLTDEEFTDLAKLIAKIENHYGFPVDVEWARENGKFFIVQSRPITTLETLKEGIRQAEHALAQKIIKDYNVKPPFIHKGFHAKFYPIDFVQLLWNRWGDYSGYYYKLHVSILHNDYWDLYYLPEEFTALRNHYFGKFKRDPRYLEKHYSDWRDSCLRLEEKIEKLDSAIQTKDFKEIVRTYQEFVDEYVFEYALSAPIQEACGFQPKQWIIPKIEEYVKQYGLDYQETMVLLISPVTHSFITKEEISLLEIILRRKPEDGAGLEQGLEEHAKKWYWIQNNYADIRVLGINFFQDKAAKLQELGRGKLEERLSELEKGALATAEKKNALFKKFPPAGDLQQFVKINEVFAEMQDVRKSFVLRANHYHKVFLEKVSEEYDHPIENLWFYSYGELLNAIEQKVFIDDEEIGKRKVAIAEVQSRKEKIILSGDEAGFLREYLESDVVLPSGVDLVKEYKLDQSTWTYKGFHGVLHPFFPVGETGIAMQDFFGDSSTVTLFFVQNNYVHWYWNDNDLTRIRNEFLERLKKDKNYLKKLQAEWQGAIRNFDRTIKEVEAANLSRFLNEELCTLYDRYYKDYVKEFKYFMVLGDAISMHADRYLVPEFEKALGEDFTKVFPQLAITHHTSFLEEENIARRELLEILKKKRRISKELLEKHAAQYFYIQNNYAKGIKLNADDFEKFLQADLKKNAEEVKESKKEQIVRKKELVKKYKLSEWHQLLLYLMDEFFGIQDTRKKYVLISNYYQFNFLREAERRTGIPFDLLRYSIYPEYRSVLTKTIDQGILKRRAAGCICCIHTKEKYEIIDGLEAERALQYLQGGGETKEELKGMVASIGRAKGRVKIILKVHDMVNMEQGDVLVTSMTRPEMAPVMKLAVAIVTDEGGITSHAAIVSRELKIPCIIGTKIATKTLKDGDLVEVDADSGVVKILERS